MTTLQLLSDGSKIRVQTEFAGQRTPGTEEELHRSGNWMQKGEMLLVRLINDVKLAEVERKLDVRLVKEDTLVEEPKLDVRLEVDEKLDVLLDTEEKLVLVLKLDVRLVADEKLVADENELLEIVTQWQHSPLQEATPQADDEHCRTEPAGQVIVTGLH